jgi:glycosidase
MRLLLSLALWCISLIANAQIDFRKETIYFLITTRFSDGDPSNNRPNEWCSYYEGNPNNANFSGPEDVTWRGDFKGLIQKLDYIKDLGFTAIWITPIVQNRGPLDYHGYHAWDFTKVDPRYESPGAKFKDLVDAAHAKGMKVVLDVVTNHSGRFGIKGQAEIKYNTDPAKAWGQKKDGTPLGNNPSWEYDGLNANPDDGKIWSRSNLAKMPAPFNQNLAAWNWPSTESFVTTSDPNWFHQSGNGFAQGWDDTENLYNRALADDCPDLNTGSLAVQDYMFNAYKPYLDAGVDAFRWDTWKHMDKQEIFALYDRFKAYKPDLFVFGEVAQKRHELHPVEEINPHWYTWRGATGSSAPAGVGVIDFYAMSTFHGVFQNGGGLGGVTAAARYDHLYGDASKLVTFLDNHDFGPNNDWNQRYGGSPENLAACMNFMFTWRGIPSVYYGTEMQFKKGAYTDLHNGEGIRRSINETGRAYYGDVMSNAPNHKVYQHIKKLNAIRKAVPALQTGNWNWAGNAPGNAVGYTRQAGNSFVCVGLAKDGNASFNFTGIPNGMYRDAVTGREVNVSGGTLQFTVASTSAGIYVKEGPGMIGESGAGFFEPCANGCVNPVTLQIIPVGTNYDAPVNVNMTANGGNGGKTIYYTNDGSLPSTASALYTGGLTINTATTIRAIAVDANGRQSELQAQRYTFEKAPPVLWQ